MLSLRLMVDTSRVTMRIDQQDRAWYKLYCSSVHTPCVASESWPGLYGDSVCLRGTDISFDEKPVSYYAKSHQDAIRMHRFYLRLLAQAVRRLRVTHPEETIYLRGE